MDTKEPPVNRLDLLLLIQACNRRQLSLEEILRLSLEWVEAMRRKYDTNLQKPAAPD
jgi:hypothetical protein